MQTVRSATPIEPIVIEPNGFGGADVWLYADIMEVTDDDENGTQTFWDAADCIHGTVQGIPTAEEIEESFDEWWERLAEQSITEADRLDKLEAQVLYTALMTDTEV